MEESAASIRIITMSLWCQSDRGIRKSGEIKDKKGFCKSENKNEGDVLRRFNMFTTDRLNAFL